MCWEGLPCSRGGSDLAAFWDERLCGHSHRRGPAVRVTGVAGPGAPQRSRLRRPHGRLPWAGVGCPECWSPSLRRVQLCAGNRTQSVRALPACWAGPGGCTRPTPRRVCIEVRFGKATGALGKALRTALLLWMKEQSVEAAGVWGPRSGGGAPAQRLCLTLTQAPSLWVSPCQIHPSVVNWQGVFQRAQGFEGVAA